MEKYIIGFIDEEPQPRINFKSNFEDDFEVKIIELDTTNGARDLLESSLQEGVDILLIDYNMTAELGYNAEILEEEIKKLNPHFPFLIITSETNAALDHIDNPGIIYSKSIWDSENKDLLADFKLKLKRIIEKYKKILIDYDKELESLIEKSEVTTLSKEEEDRYREINKFLCETKGDFTHSDYYSTETNEKLDEIIKKTEELLDKLEKNA